MHSHSIVRPVATVVAAAAMLACGDPASPSVTTPGVSFSISTAEKIGATANRASYALTGNELIIGVGADTLRIDSVRVVLAQVTLAHTSALCGTAGHDDSMDTDCANLSSGPFIVTVPLTSGVLPLMDVPIPAGSYSRLSVRVHKANTTDASPAVIAFLQAHPEWFNKSAMVDGTFNGVAFHWSHDPPIQLNHTFEPPLVISASGSNFTLKIEVATWFKSATGALINPGATTNAAYPQIAANVAKSFKLFRDNSKAGHDDGK